MIRFDCFCDHLRSSSWPTVEASELTWVVVIPPSRPVLDGSIEFDSARSSSCCWGCWGCCNRIDQFVADACFGFDNSEGSLVSLAEMLDIWSTVLSDQLSACRLICFLVILIETRPDSNWLPFVLLPYVYFWVIISLSLSLSLSQHQLLLLFKLELVGAIRASSGVTGLDFRITGAEL